MACLPACTAFNDFMAPLRDDEPPVVAELPPIEERPRLDPISRNYFVVASPDQSVIGEPQVVFASEENTFSDLAREYGLGYDELVEANPDVDPWLPGDGTPILLPTQFVLPDVPREGIILNIASKRLFYFPQVTDGQEQIVMTYPIGIGRVGWETPLGSSAVVSKARDPHWYVPASVRREHEEIGDPLPSVVPPGPDNPLGKHVLKLDIPGYLIHGTNQPYGVGMRVSHGCVRLYPENIELLYELVGVGEPVNIINEPFLAGWRDGGIFFEAHSPLVDDEVSPEGRLVEALAVIENLSSQYETPVDIDQLVALAASATGVPAELSGNDPQEVYARARIVKNTVEPDPDLPTLDEVRAILDAPIDTEEVASEQAVADE
jgi:L,D-transpeptidase ErfK/SrfK